MEMQQFAVGDRVSWGSGVARQPMMGTVLSHGEDGWLVVQLDRRSESTVIHSVWLIKVEF
jgi:hypothetical protein